MAGEGCAMCTFCLYLILGLCYTVINIVALVASSDSEGNAMQVEEGTKYYLTLPLISMFIPNPITTGMTAFTNCTEFNNCGESYRDLYLAVFGINIVTICLFLGMICCGILCAK